MFIIDVITLSIAKQMFKQHTQTHCRFIVETHVKYHPNVSTHIHYRKTHDISRTLVDNTIVDNSDVVGASSIGAAPTTSSSST